MALLKAVRTELAASLKSVPGLKGWVMFPDGNTFRDTATKPTVLIERTEVERLPQAPMGHYLNTLTLTLIDPKVDDEDHLDDLLDAFLEALDEQAQVAVSKAERGVFAGTNPCYKLTITATSERKA